MNKKLTILFCVLSIVCFTFSVAIHYQSPDYVSPQQDSMRTLETSTRRSIDWLTELKIHSQFKPQLEVKSQTELLVEHRIQDTRLIGIVRGEKMLAIFSDPTTNKVRRINPGTGWLDNWILEKIEADHVIWRDEETNERYIQRLFKSSHEDKSLLSSLNGK